MEKIQEIAYAKINLGLDVLGKRADGYHEVSMIMQSISLADVIEVEARDEGLIVETGRSDLPGDRSNLATKAALLLAERFGKEPKLKITLTKQIFMAAGLAGGSSDAAAVLRALNRFWKLGLTVSQLEEVGAELGSDVPFCIAGGTALAEGRGEKLTSLPEPEESIIVLAKPPIEVSTAWVYGNLNLQQIDERPDIKLMTDILQKGKQTLPIEGMANVLESVTEKAHPEIGRIKEKMMAAGASFALMSGSGPTVFAVAPNLKIAEKIVAELKCMQVETAVTATIKRSVI